PPPYGVRGLDYPFAISGAARLVSTPSPFWGLARDRHVTGFPEFEQFCIAGFPASTQVLLKSGAYAISPRPRGLHRFYPSCSVVGSSFFFFVFGRRMLIAAASRLFLRCEA